MTSMDPKRLGIAIAISVAILLVFELFVQGPLRQVQRTREAEVATVRQAEAEAARAAAERARAAAPPGETAREAPRAAPDVRIRIDAPRVQGHLNLTGARIDDLMLRDFGMTVARDSERVQLLSPRTSPQPYFAQFGWTASSGGRAVAVPDASTAWNTSASALTPASPVTLWWENGQGQRFEIIFSIDDNFMFRVDQRVVNSAAETVEVTPWGRIRREYTPPTGGYYILHEGLVGVTGGRLHEFTYRNARDEAAKTVEGRPAGTVFSTETTGGWAGITDKYWLTALIPDQAVEATMAFRLAPEEGKDRWQVDFLAPAKTLGRGEAASTTSHFFAGAKEVRLLDRYAAALHIDGFYRAIDWGWFEFLTRPIFFALDYIFLVIGNFGVAILIFTLLVKALFFPLANKSYKAMAKMKALQPKMAELKEKLGGDSQAMQREMMALYKREKVNPVSGCLPMFIQIPVFFSLYKVLVVTIEMRHAPFVLWIRDLSAPDPTNIFNLFGLIPFDPTTLPGLGPFLHLGVFPLFMGLTMWLQQRLNPQPTDPVQAKVFAWMPVIFTFMLGTQPAGLVIYWAWNNLLSIGQQWLIMKRQGIANPIATT